VSYYQCLSPRFHGLFEACFDLAVGWQGLSPRGQSASTWQLYWNHTSVNHRLKTLVSLNNQQITHICPVKGVGVEFRTSDDSSLKSTERKNTSQNQQGISVEQVSIKDHEGQVPLPFLANQNQ